MEQLIKDRYSDAVLQEAMQRYDISREQIKLLDSFESFIYEFENASGAYILRIAHSSRRSEALIQGEVDWINYLADGGVSAARAVLSARGNLVEAIEDGQGGAFLATAFVKAQGGAPWDLWTPQLYETYGQLIGHMHMISKQYRPTRPEWKRPAWDADMFEFVDRYLPQSESAAKRKYRGACAHVNSLPKGRDEYGMTHQDPHGNNFFVDSAGRITLFDFDECAYNWFVNDIAVVLFYIIQDAEDWPTFTQEFMGHFLKGYVQACPLHPGWLKEIPHFLKIREIELYAVMHRDFDVTNISDEWCARFMQGRKEKIDQGVPYIDFDFDSLSIHL
jgi:Ser/Thr protein kinase RdoA (MazF antagonist)